MTKPKCETMDKGRQLLHIHTLAIFFKQYAYASYVPLSGRDIADTALNTDQSRSIKKYHKVDLLGTSKSLV